MTYNQDINKQNLYGFTLKETATPERNLSELDYQECLKEISKRGEILDLHYETTRKDHTPARLHCHGIVSFKRIPKLTTICPTNFSTRFERIYNLTGWQKYCTKEIDRIDNNQYMF